MTFGREVVNPGEFNEHGEMTRQPVLGALRTFTFAEGKEYRVSPDMAHHLRGLGYVYSF